MANDYKHGIYTVAVLANAVVVVRSHPPPSQSSAIRLKTADGLLLKTADGLYLAVSKT